VGDEGDDEESVNPENLCTKFFGMNLAAPDWSVGRANSAEGFLSHWHGVGKVRLAVGVVGELGWIVSSGGLNGGLGLAVVGEAEVGEVGYRYQGRARAWYRKRRQGRNRRCRMRHFRRPQIERLGLNESCLHIQSLCHVSGYLKNDRSGIARDRGDFIRV